MSPDPTQEPIEETLNAPHLSIGLRGINESDSEDDDLGLEGYIPLSQNSIDSDPMLLEEEDDDWMPAHGEPGSTIPEGRHDEVSESVEVWSSSPNLSNIDMDADKIDQVKSMMASFTLPTTAIPEWAKTISEEQWKEKLIDRIKEMQNREK